MVERVIGNDEVTGPIPVPSFFDFKAEWLENEGQKCNFAQ